LSALPRDWQGNAEEGVKGRALFQAVRARQRRPELGLEQLVNETGIAPQMVGHCLGGNDFIRATVRILKPTNQTAVNIHRPGDISFQRN